MTPEQERAITGAAAEFGIRINFRDGPSPESLVALTLEETGWLCHLLMAKIKEMGEARDLPPFSVFDTTEIRAAIFLRMTILYDKLVVANDRLMAKEHDELSAAQKKKGRK